ncbi:MAG TPA: sigma-54-dependent Fis family transcriptional regulator, partial [Telluria sp.]|nr:sigma-54-dependent Fis family transcriptional regulator [Telluria sp.]
AVQRAAERQHELVLHARPVMEYLHSQTRDSGSMVILADDRGVLVHTLGDADFVDRAERVALAPGASWAEHHRGTNAIGTALAEGGPVAVHGAEHYLERNGFLTCAAATVCAPDGRLLGVLDISGDQRGRHPHTFGLVRAAAQMIENRLFDARHGEALRLRFHPLAEGIGTIAEGVVALSDDGWIMGANPAGLALLGLRPADLRAVPITQVLQLKLDDLVDWGRRRGGEALRTARSDGSRLHVRVEPGRLARRVHVAQPQEQRVDDALARLDTGDARLRAAIDKARRVLGKPIPLLLQGESGVGKELFAQAWHASGTRRGQAFVAVNCATLPESLIEAELFGHAPGAFTGARKEGSAGRIRAAHGGTLFLDEIGDMPLAQQARLLRVLQEREVVPVGGAQPVAVDFVLICATHRDLKAEVAAGRFRADLYYRINGLALLLPPLRERADFNALVARLLDEFAAGTTLDLEPELERAFAAYAWPGNLRQLANVLRTACALLDPDESRIGWQHLADDLCADLRQQPPAIAAQSELPATDHLQTLSDAVMERAIAASRGNMSEAARRLGVSRNTLYRRLKRAGL